MKSGAALVGMLNPFDRAGLDALAAAGLTSFALEAAPRTTRAQSMDVLSSQANIAGYKAVMIAADKYQRFFPMLMTAAGTVKAARVVILGVGVAGLQAIATAKRLGAVIEASDVRPSVKEQVESLGGKFIDVPYETAEEKEAAEGVGGYARPMPQSWLDRQKVEVAKRVAAADVVISTALIPGRAAPTLITEEMVKAMKPGSVIVDLAAGKGPTASAATRRSASPTRRSSRHGVTIVGETNLAARVGADASSLYARNVLDFLKLVLTKEGGFAVPMDDDIVAACLMTQGGDGASAPDERTNLERRPERERSHGRRLPHRHQPDHLRARDLRRLPRRLDRDAGAAHAADGGDQRDLGDRHRRRDARRRAHRDAARQGDGRARGRARRGQRLRRLPRDATNARDVQEEGQAEGDRGAGGRRRSEPQSRHAAVPGGEHLLHPGAEGPEPPDDVDPRQPLRHGRHGDRRASRPRR